MAAALRGCLGGWAGAGQRRRVIHEAAQHLVAGQLKNGMWAYRLALRTTAESTHGRDGVRGLGTPDNSNTQFAARAGATPDEREVMLGPIDAFRAEKGERLEWDEARARFDLR